MKLTVFFLCLVALSCSSPKNQKEIEAFEDTLGEKHIEVLNLLVDDFENNLEKQYPNLRIRDAYKQYLLDVKNYKTEDSLKYRFQSKKTNKLFHSSGFWDEIYYYEYYSENLFGNSIDSTKSLQINNIGKYMIALNKIMESDSLVGEYYKLRESAGLVSNKIFVDGFLSNNPNFDNYIHKRIVVIEYSF